MSSRSSRIQIPKDLDIEELVEEYTRLKNMDDVMDYLLSEIDENQIDDEDLEEVVEEVSEDEIEEPSIKKEPRNTDINKELEHYYARRESEERKEQERVRLLKAIAKLEEEQNKNEDPEIEEFFAEIKRKTAEIVEMQNENKNGYIKNNDEPAKVEKVNTSRRVEKTVKKKEIKSNKEQGEIDLIKQIESLEEDDGTDFRRKYKAFNNTKSKRLNNNLGKESLNDSQDER